MELRLSVTTLLATLAVSLAQQQPQQAPLAPQGGSAPLLGVRYSAATDVSHTSFNSPRVTYGSSLNEIQLPAAPIQPANLKQVPQNEGATEENNDESQPSQALAKSFGNQGQTHQQIQSPTPPNQQQFISVQQYPANPQLQSTPQGFSLSQTLPGHQPQQQYTPRYALQQPTVQSQPQYVQQQQYPLVQQQQPQQYFAPQPQQQYVLPQPQPQQYVAPQQQYPASNGYFATGPYAAQYPQPNLVARQVAAPILPQYAQPVVTQYQQPLASAVPQYAPSVVPAAQLVSRVAFNGPTTGFSYSF